MIEAQQRELQEVKDWNKMLANHNEQLAQRGDDLEELLAQQMPTDCVVVPREPTREMLCAWRNTEGTDEYYSSGKGIRLCYENMIAVGEVK